ncbi:MAG: hypothetical protein WC375_06950 [Methanomassiliicoccales archaeon]|jgi:hypothetical protein
MADEPVIAAAMNLIIAMAKFPIIAATTAIFDSECPANDYNPTTISPLDTVVDIFYIGYHPNDRIYITQVR